MILISDKFCNLKLIFKFFEFLFGGGAGACIKLLKYVKFQLSFIKQILNLASFFFTVLSGNLTPFKSLN